MALYNFHRVLIVSAVLFFFGFAIYCVLHAKGAQETQYMTMTAGSTVAGVVLLGYFVYFNIALRRLNARP